MKIAVLSQGLLSRIVFLSGPQTHLTMNLAGGQQRGEVSEVLETVIESPVHEDIRKNLQVHTVRKPCSSAKIVSRKSKTIADKLHLSGGTVDLLIGTDFVDAFVDIHTNSSNPGEPWRKGIVLAGISWNNWTRMLKLYHVFTQWTLEL